MSLVTVKALVASTHPVDKYPEWKISRDALEGLARALREGKIPMLFEHDVTQTIQARVIDAYTAPVDDGHHAVAAVFEVDADAWSEVETRFRVAGVLGGFSYRATAPQFPSKTGLDALVTLAVDAAAWTDKDRADAGALLDSVVPTRTELLFEYSGLELATLLIVIGQGVGLGILANAAYDAVKLLMTKRTAETRIEIHQHRADGSELKAVVRTKDPELARDALQKLTAEERSGTVSFDPCEQLWLDH